MRAIPLVAVVVLGACGTVQSDPVYLRHTETGEIVRCGPYSTLGVNRALAAAEFERNCVADYREQGYLRVPAP